MRTAETITVGSELTRGLNIDTHSALLARALMARGLRVRFQTSVADVRDEISEAVSLALTRADCVIVAGGLGPTLDDLTREAVASATGRTLTEDPQIWAGIRRRFEAAGRVPTENNRRQALVVEGSTVLPNPEGTAPGFRLELDGKALFALPGPPRELGAMLDAEVLPWLEARRGVHAAQKVLKVYGLGESYVDAALRALVPEGDSVSLALLAKSDHLEVILSAVDADVRSAEARVETLVSGVSEILGERVYSFDGRDLAEVVVDLLKEQRLDLAVAESCTGGGLAARVAAVPGASEVFLGGVVAYANALKRDLLDVPAFVLERAGAVSRDCALAMAVGLARRLDADYSLSITGVAGPGGGSPEKPVGTVHFALAGPSGIVHQVCRFTHSDRAGVQTRAVQTGLWMVYAALVGLDIPEEGGDRGTPRTD